MSQALNTASDHQADPSYKEFKWLQLKGFLLYAFYLSPLHEYNNLVDYILMRYFLVLHIFLIYSIYENNVQVSCSC